MKLVIVHNHFRPGGVRRVIELAAPYLIGATKPRVGGIVLVAGEAPDERWLGSFRKHVGAVPVDCMIEPALGYVSEQRVGRRTMEKRIRLHLQRCLDEADVDRCIVWAHNQGLGRNLVLTLALQQICAARKLPLVLHHHDWWFDNRWTRWPEMRLTGFRRLADVARTIFSTTANVRHASINRSDASVLQHHLGRQAGWLPNLAEAAPLPSRARSNHARGWLRSVLQEDAPVWLVPCRLLRRKNIAEALLLTRWLRPEAWLVTTGGASSADERIYAETLSAAARRHNWRLRLSVLAGDESRKPSVEELLAASETLLLTSLQEGFGLPNLEAAAAGRPLIVRTLPNIAPDLAQFGFKFPQSYEEILIDPRLFDCHAEMRRQKSRWETWRAHLPQTCRALAGQPPWLALRARPVPFSRLTLIAQMEVLARDPLASWELCAPLNEFLKSWREKASRGLLGVSRWPASARRWLSGAAYARGFANLMNAEVEPIPAAASDAVSREFIRAKLTGTNQYPLLWTRDA